MKSQEENAQDQPKARKPRTTAKAKAPQQTIDITPRNASANLPAQVKRQTSALAKSSLDHNDKNSIANYGVEVQKKLGSFSSTVLQQVRATDAGDVGMSINKLLTEIKRVDVDPSDQGNAIMRFFSAIPFLGSLVNKGGELMTRYETVEENINDIVAKMQKSRHSLMRDNTSMDVMFTQQQEYVRDIEGVIEDGEVKLAEMREGVIPALRADIDRQLAAGGEEYSLDLQQLNDYIAFADRLEKKIHNLKISRVVALQTLPQIRIIQENNDVLMEQVQDTISTTIPLWRQQVALALNLNTQQGVAQISAMSSKMTNDLLSKNSAMLKQNSIEVAKQNEKAVVDMETLRKVNSDIMGTLTEVVRIKEEGSQKRLQATKELENIEKEFIAVAMKVVDGIERTNDNKARELGA